MRKKHQPGCPCCIDDICEQLAACFEVVGSDAGRNIEVTISGVSNLFCNGCGTFNRTHIFTASVWFPGDPCRIQSTKPVSVGNCGNSSLNISLGLDQTGPNTLSFLAVGAIPLDGGVWGWGEGPFGGPAENPVLAKSAILSLCAGGTVELPIQLDESPPTFCNNTTATCRVRLL